MRVDYTLPALQPEPLPDVPGTGETRLSFRQQLRETPTPLPIASEQTLRLDVRPFTASYIGPPPRPASLQVNDAETERLRWHNMVRRHASSDDALISRPAGTHAVQTMMAMLVEMQQMEDSIVAREVAVTRG